MNWIVGIAVAVAQLASITVDDLAWLQGHWRTEVRNMRNGANWTEELWLGPAFGSMLGVGRGVGGLRTTSYDFMRIALDPGGIAFHGSPSGQPSVRFGMVSSGPNMIVFENPDHDYPQRIAYRRDGDVLTATISMADGSRARSWTYRRQPPR
jgi:hypothetical protein